MSDHLLAKIQLNPESDLPLIFQISQQLTWLIASGELKEGDKLPAMRQLAEGLGVHMHTVRLAYQRLEADQLVSIRTRRGTVVLPFNPAALAQRGSEPSTFLLGVILPNPGTFYTPFIQAIQELARDLRYLPLFCYTFENSYLAESYFNQLIARQVEGFILASLSLPSVLDQPGKLDSYPPIVSVDMPEMPGYRVLIDHEGAAYQLSRHLLDHGYQRIGLITPPLEWPNVTPFFRGYEKALREAGVEPSRELISQVEGFFESHGREGAEHLLSLAEPPAAILAAADSLALGAMQAIKAEGLSIPGDLALVGYNDIPAAGQVFPGLTTSAVPAAELGSQAFELLQSLLKGKQPQKKTRVIPAELIIRQSCGC